jgi:hypothetical protein
MATKVMLAPAIARRQTNPDAATTLAAAKAKPKRRRSSVYDADGNEVFITLLCLKCRRMRPLAQFGLRRMADGAIRNQPWCRTCRVGAGPESPRRKRGCAAEEVRGAAPDAEQGVAGATPPDPSKLAAQVLAALQGGRR